MSNALAHVNWGKWVAQCPVPGCRSGWALEPGQSSMTCSMGHTSPVVWPGNAASRAAIMKALAKRPNEGDRNWFPAGEPTAVAAGYPVDQTPAQIDSDTAAQEAVEAATDAQKAELLALLAKMNIPIADDGTILGKV
jgi:hypothetical protein